MTSFPIPLPPDHPLRDMMEKHRDSMHKSRIELEQSIVLDEKLIASHKDSLKESRGQLAYVVNQIAVCDEALAKETP